MANLQFLFRNHHIVDRNKLLKKNEIGNVTWDYLMTKSVLPVFQMSYKLMQVRAEGRRGIEMIRSNGHY